LTCVSYEQLNSCVYSEALCQETGIALNRL